MISLRGLIKKYHISKSYVKIYVDGPHRDGEGFNVNGFIIGFDNNKILISQNNDFVFDGYVYVPIDRIGNIYHFKDKIVYENIMNSQGLLDNMYEGYNSLPKIMNVDTYAEIFTTLKDSKIIVIIDCDLSSKNGRHSGARHIGYVDSIRKKGILFKYFNTMGVFNKNPYYIPFTSIMTLSIGGSYSNAYQTYLQSQ